MKVKVWLPHNTPNEEKYYFLCANDMSTYGYTHIGDADVSITHLPEVDIVTAKINSLNSQIKTIQADAESKINRIKDEISNLQAITYEAH